MLIVGAGLSGLIAGHYFRRHKPLIIERQKSLPNNHHALLRFRSDVISRITGVPFKKVLVRKGMIYKGQVINHTNIHMCNLYALKVTGQVLPRSVWDLSPVERYIAPPNFIEQLAASLDIVYETDYSKTSTDPRTISTMPLYSLANILGIKYDLDFISKEIWTIKTNIKVPKTEVYQTIYYPHLELDQYRASICGDELIIECIVDPEQPDKIVRDTLLDFGIPYTLADFTEPEVKSQPLGKLLPIDNRKRRSLIYSITQEYGIYSLGRFATWRQILLDDLAKDLQVIEGFIESSDDYLRHIKRS